MIFISENTKISRKRQRIRKWAFGLIMVLTISGVVVACSLAGKPSDIAPEGSQYRPVIHFTPDSMWMNDPNGLVFLDGEYHLFYQHYPDSNVWGPMHWGHAVSTDLVHWQHLPIALYPDSLGYIFSGSAVVDINNTSGFGTKENPAIVAVFTYHDMAGEKAGRNDYQTQGIAYSTDKGRTWTKYDKNPVLKNPGQRDFRDPKVIWHKESNKWVMTLASGDHIAFYSSPNLKEWTFESEFGQGIGAHGGVWECPDLFELSVEGQSSKKWVLLVSINPGGPNGGSATQYFVGDFDGHMFTNQSAETRWMDYGKDNYAGVTFSNIPESDGRRILIGWMSNWQYAQVVPTLTWRSAMTFPRVLKLWQDDNGYVLHSTPVDEIQLLREEKTEVTQTLVTEEKEFNMPVPSQPFPLEIIASFSIPAAGAATAFNIELYNDEGDKVIIGYDRIESKFFIDRTKSGLTDFSDDFPGSHYSAAIDKTSDIEVHLIIDAASVELFAQNGRIAMTEIYFPKKNLDKMKVTSKNGNILVKEGTIYKLTSHVN